MKKGVFTTFPKITRITLTLVAGMAVFLLLLHPAYGDQLVVNKGKIAKDTTWQGEILIKGDVEVVKGATLTILPGTVVRFEKIKEFGPQKLFTDKAHHFSRSELFVTGKLIAKGTADKKISFTSAAQSPSPGDWGSVNFLSSVGNILENCVFTYGQTAIHCHSASAIIDHSTFKYNGTAIGQKNLKGNPIKCVVPMTHNLITENGGGILYGGGSTPTITHNEITKNTFFGIYVKKGGLAKVHFNNITQNGKGIIFYVVKNIDLRDNNISDNIDYNISLLEGQSGDIIARYNWWGSADEKAIQKYVMDNNRDNTLGNVDLANFYQAPVPGAGLL